METTTVSAVEHLADMVTRTGQLLAHFYTSTDTERRTWSPTLGEGCVGRCALDQLAECTGLNSMVAALMRGETPSAGDDGHGGATLTDEDAPSKLIASSRELAEAIRNGGEPTLAKSYTLPFGTFTGWEIAEICLFNMHYHGGQINYIQLLYGDKVFHFPGA